MKKITNKTLKDLNLEKLQDFGDFLFVLENSSFSYRQILWQFYEYQKRRCSGFWHTICKRIDSIAKDVGCSEKTVDRFLRDRKYLMQWKRRSIQGKQTSSSYAMPKKVYQWMKAVSKVGLLKSKDEFGWRLKFLASQWQNSYFDFDTLMNNLKRPKHNRFKPLDTSSEHPQKKMSLGYFQKCPSNTYSNFLSNKGTPLVPPKEAIKVENAIQKWIRKAYDDLKFYSVEKKNQVNSYHRFILSRMKAHSLQI